MVHRVGVIDGPKVICVHGFADNASAFLPLQNREGAGMAALEFTRSGHWKSVDDPQGTARIAADFFIGASV